MEEKKGFLSRKKEDWKTHVFRKPSRHWWAVAGLAASLAMLYCGLALPAGEYRTGVDGVAVFQYFGLFEGLGTFFGSVAELLPEEQTTLAGILRMWAGLFVGCGLLLMLAGMILGSGAL